MKLGIFEKGSFLMTGIIVLFLCLVPLGNAEEKNDPAPSKREMINIAKTQLDNTTWQIKLTEMSSTAKKKTFKDEVRFINGRVESKKLLPEGFSATNFTVRIKGKEDEIIIWETMQTSQDNGVAFWRGEIVNDTMRGVLSRHISEGNKEDYSFISTGKEGILKEPEIPALEGKAVKEAVIEEETEIIHKAESQEKLEEPKAAEEQEVKEEAEEEVVKEKKKQKRRRWF